MSKKTNAQAVLQLVADNLLDLIDEDTLDLAGVYCIGASPHCDDEAPDNCRECLREWLAQPYTGQLAVVDGRIVRQE